MATFNGKLSSASTFLVALLVSATILGSGGLRGAEASCTVQNNSGKKVIVLPVNVDVEVAVDVGANVTLPVSYELCSLENAGTQHKSGPLTLVDGTLYVIVDAADGVTVDVWSAINVLGVLQLVATICVSL